MTEALTTQVDGTHYVKLKLQPVEFAMKNFWDFCAGSSLKYLTRWRDKAGVVDLGKAKHFVQLREATLSMQGPRIRATYSMQDFVKLNSIPESDARALYALEDYVMWNGTHRAEIVMGEIDRMITLANA